RLPTDRFEPGPCMTYADRQRPTADSDAASKRRAHTRDPAAAAAVRTVPMPTTKERSHRRERGAKTRVSRPLFSQPTPGRPWVNFVIGLVGVVVVAGVWEGAVRASIVDAVYL